MKSLQMIVALSWLGLSACGAPPEPTPEPVLPAEPLESEHGQDVVFAPSLASGANGQLALSWAGPKDVYVKRWTGSRWETLGSGLSAFTGESRAFWSSVQVDAQGNPVVAWQETEPGELTRERILVRRWAGDRWVQLGGPLNLGPETSGASKPSLRLDAEGNPLVAWSESSGADAQLTVRRWSAGGWQALGPTPIAPGRVSALELAGNTPVLVSERPVDHGLHQVIEVRRWTGSTWESLGAPMGERAIAPQVRADAAGNLFLAWLEEGTSPAYSRIQVARWSGAAWEALGSDVAVSDANNNLGVPVLELDAEGRPVVAWNHAQALQGLRVARWTGQGWNVKVVEESSFPGSSSGSATLAFHPTEGMVVAWVPHELAKLRVLRVLP